MKRPARATPLLRVASAAQLRLSRLASRVVPAVIRQITRVPARDRPEGGGRPRVTIVLMNAYAVGGTIRTAFNLAGYLAKHYDVDLVSVRKRKRKPMLPFPDGVRLIALDDIMVTQPRRWTRARDILDRIPSPLVNSLESRYHEFSVWTDLLVLQHLRKTSGLVITTRPGLNLLGAQYAPQGLPVIGQEHMNLSSHKKALRADIKRHYPRLAALAVLTQGDLREYAELFGANPPPRLVHRPNAVPEIDGGMADLSSKVVVAAGRLTRQKGFDLLIPAWAPVAEKHPDWRLVIFGDGQERPVLEALVEQHGLAGSVSLPGRTQQLGHEFARSSIFVLSSRREGLPMVLLEAMSKGLPVVSFDCPTGPAEVITDDNGILVPNADLPALSAALSTVIADTELRTRLGKGALETAARYDVDVIGQQWVDLIEEILTESASSPTRR